MIALSAFSLHRSYHCYTAFLNEDYLDKSNTKTTPWQPLKYVDTMDLYFYWPAVSQIYNLASLLCKLIFFILKSIVVTCVYFYAKKFPSVNLQNKAVLPTLLSPTRINLYFFSYPYDKYRYSIIIFEGNFSMFLCIWFSWLSILVNNYDLIIVTKIFIYVYLSRIKL